jgi:cysteine desulfurase
MKSIYLDNAATTPLAPEVFEAMVPFLKDHFGNPSSTHQFGRKTKSAVENARRTIAYNLNVTPREICFTSGGTEADNLAIRSAVYDLGCTHIITSKIEHKAVLTTSQLLAEKGVVRISYVDLHRDGQVDLNSLEELLSTDEKSLVSLMHCNNEIATRIPLKEIGELCAQNDAIFHSDTVQSMCHYAFDLTETHVHFITGSAHKFHGPKGIGFLYVNKDIRINALITGGGQERQLRGGTENVYAIVGLGKAVEIAYKDMDAHRAHIWGVKNHMINRLETEIPGVEFNGDSKSPDSLYTVLNITLPECPNSSMMLFLLDLEGIACSGGSACSSGATQGSHVLAGINAIKDKRTSLRFSFSRYTTKEEVDFCMEKLKALCQVSTTANQIA